MAVRVYQIAKEYSRSAEEIMDILRSSGIPVSSHTAVLDQHALHTVRAKLGKFELTVVDGESRATIGSRNEKRQKGGKGKQQQKPAPKLQVRIIKKDQAQENAETEEQPAEKAEAPKPKRPKLKKRKPKTSVEERINQAARQDDSGKPAEAGTEAKAAKPAPAAPTAEKPAQSGQAGGQAPQGERRDSRDGGQRDNRGGYNRDGQRDNRGGYSRDGQGGGQRDNRGGYNRDGQRDNRGGYNRDGQGGGQRDNRGGYNRDGQGGGQRDNRGGYSRDGQGGGQRDNRGGYNRDGGQRGGYSGGGQGGQRGGYNRDGQGGGQRGGYGGGQGGQGGQRGGYSGGGQGGQRGGYSGGGQGGQRGGYSGGGGQGGQRGGYGGGQGGQRGGYSGGGGQGGQRGGYGGGGQGGQRGGYGGGQGGQRGGYSGGGQGGQRGGYGGGGQRGGQGGNRGGRGPRQPATTDMLREQFTMAQPSGGAAKANTMRLKGPARPASKKKKKKKKHEENISRMKPVAVSKVELPSEELGIIMLSEGVTVKELAEKVDRKAKDVIKRLFEKGIMATLNHVLESDLAIEIAKDFGYEAEIVSFEEDLQLQEDETLVTNENDGSANLIERAPIVTIMGHVDHGKTTLLDAIRSTKVASGEAGGITQHIGAYAVQHDEKDIVFLDTPGHEAFTKMRARGASVTDIVILVVAADDGVKPQTIEAISHAKAAKVPIIVCVNKIDKPEANPDRVKQMLTEHELVVEDFGGDSPCVQVSAKKGQGIDELLEMILLVAELNNYTTNPTRKAQGTVIEAKLDRGRGPVATLIVQDGTLKIGDYYITGSTYGKIRAMHDDLGANVEIATPSTPVEVLGIQEVPSAGDIFRVVNDEATARQVSAFRKEKVKEDQFRRQKHTSLDQLFSNLKQDEIKELRLIIKADVQGSLEGMSFALSKLESEKVNLRIVHQGVGSITENDVLLAAASDSIIIGFNTKGEKKAMDLAEQEQIDVHFYSVIYEVVREIEAAMVGLIAPSYREKDVGKAIVKQVFNVAKLGAVAGCSVETGYVKRSCGVRVMRGEDELFKGELATLKRFRDDVNEVKAGTECGIGIKDFSEFREQDQFVFFEMEKVMPTKL